MISNRPQRNERENLSISGPEQEDKQMEPSDHVCMAPDSLLTFLPQPTQREGIFLPQEEGIDMMLLKAIIHCLPNVAN